MVGIFLNKIYSSDPMCNGGGGYCVMCTPPPLRLVLCTMSGTRTFGPAWCVWQTYMQCTMTNKIENCYEKLFPNQLIWKKNISLNSICFLKQYLARSSVDTILGYLQLISAKLAWKSAESAPKLWQLKVLCNNILKINGV